MGRWSGRSTRISPVVAGEAPLRTTIWLYYGRCIERRLQMGKVSAGATMSLDGFIAGPQDTGFDFLFKWYNAGDVEVPMPYSETTVPAPRVSPASAELLRQEQASWGAL